MTQQEEHARYVIEEVAVIATDPHTNERVCIRMLGTGTMLVEPVMRKTDDSPKTPKFDGNQASVILQIHEKKVEQV